MSNTERAFLTIAEAAAILGLSLTTTYAAVRSGQIPAVKIGHQWRISRATLERLDGSALAGRD